MIELALVQEKFDGLKLRIDEAYAELAALALPPPEAPPGASYVIVPTTVQLFGPVHVNGAVSDSATTPKFVGNALSASCHQVNFDKPMPVIDTAFVRVIWVPGNAANFINVTHADNGPQNITVMGQIPGTNVSTPVVSGIFITEQLEALRTAGVMKQIGFQLGGNGTAVTIFEVELQINFRIPVAAVAPM